MSCPVLTKNPYRYCLFPIVHENLWDLRRKAKAQDWVAGEIDFSTDLKEWEALNPGERKFIQLILAFFAFSDGLVMENIDCNFGTEVQIPEARAFYAYQHENESVHNETYSLMIDNLIRDEKERMSTFRSITEHAGVAALIQWAERWLSKERPFAQRLVGFVIYEGLVFSSKFAAIFWFKSRNKLPAVCHANQLIARDEAMHEDFGIMLHSMLLEKCPPELIRQMVAEVVQIDTEVFMTEALSVNLIGMNKELMTEYVKLVANRILKRFGCEKLYDVNPIANPVVDIMDQISMENKTNYFEKRNPVYVRAAVVDSSKPFELSDDF